MENQKVVKKQTKKGFTFWLIIALSIVAILSISGFSLYWFIIREQNTNIKIPLNEAIEFSKENKIQSMIIYQESGTLSITPNLQDGSLTVKNTDNELKQITNKQTRLNTLIGYMTLKELTDLGFILPEDYQMKYEEPSTLTTLGKIMGIFLPLLMLIGLGIFYLYIFGVMGSTKKYKPNPNDRKITFADIGGLQEIKSDLNEIVSFLKERDKYKRSGARIPKGVLMSGLPGTGKTLIAKAIANEAKASFFYANGSEFEEMFVGSGPRRIKKMFKQAKQNQPAIIFIDEIDSIAFRRGESTSHAWEFETLNQLLTQMDGFNKTDNIMVLAATNCPEMLDKAIMRVGRFDRKVNIDLPNLAERMEIFKVHSRDKTLSEDVDMKEIAVETQGLSGADIEGIMNESAIISINRNHLAITKSDVEEAIDRISIGTKNHCLTDSERTLVAYHESGHTITACKLMRQFPSKVTITSRGISGGFTKINLYEDKKLLTKTEITNHIAVLLSGRIAEINQFGDSSIGAKNDLEQASKLAYSMITQYGMGNNLRYYNERQALSSEESKQIEDEVKNILNFAYELADSILKQYKEYLNILAKELIKRETLDSNEIKEIMGAV